MREGACEMGAQLRGGQHERRGLREDDQLLRKGAQLRGGQHERTSLREDATLRGGQNARRGLRKKPSSAAVSMREEACAKTPGSCARLPGSAPL